MGSIDECVDPCYGSAVVDELLDPTPDIHRLFCYYNDLYFKSRLESRVMVEWSSSRMTSCGGTCALLPGGGIMIRLSKPLLCLRPTSDLKDVLLHEMIHAYMMVHNIRDNDPGGHGDIFKQWMRDINMSRVPDMYRPSQGYHITVYHTMFNEVEYYRRHHWQCGRCGDVVKRSVNRRPQPADCRWYARRRGHKDATKDMDCNDMGCRWHMHSKFCGGEYVKIQEPEKTKVPKKEKKKRSDASNMLRIDTLLAKKNERNTKLESSTAIVVDLTEEDATVVDLTSE